MKTRKDATTLFPSLLILMSFASLVAAALIFFMYPGRTNVAVSVAIFGGIFLLLAFILEPTIIRDILTSRKTLLWLNDAVLIFAIVAIGVILGRIGFRHNFRYDLTRDKLFSISDATVKILRNLQKDVKITAFYPLQTPDGKIIEDLLKEYARQSTHFTFRMVDPFRDPMTAKAMNVQAAGTVIVQCETDRMDIFVHEIFPRPNPMMRQQDFKPTFQGEQMFTSAILNVTSGRKRMVQFVKGHGESSITGYDQDGYAAMNEFLNKENFDVTEGALLDGIASGVNVLAVVSPKKDFLPAEIETIRSFLEVSKGSLFIALDPDSKADALEGFLTRHFGVIANRETIIDPRGLQNLVWTVAPEFQPHPVVDPLREKKMMAILFHCRGLTYEKRDNWETKPILRTIDQAYAKRSEEELAQGNARLSFNPQFDVRGPLNLGLALEGQGPATGTRVLVLGDSSFAANGLFRNAGNTDLFINAVNWLAGQEAQISIRAKTVDLPPIVLDREASERIFYLSVLVSPLIICMIGGAVWLTRRRV